MFLMSPKLSSEVLSDVPEQKKAVICLTEKIHVIDKLGSGMSYSTIGKQFNVNESR